MKYETENCHQEFHLLLIESESVSHSAMSDSLRPLGL